MNKVIEYMFITRMYIQLGSRDLSNSVKSSQSISSYKTITHKFLSIKVQPNSLICKCNNENVDNLIEYKFVSCSDQIKDIIDIHYLKTIKKQRTKNLHDKKCPNCMQKYSL